MALASNISEKCQQIPAFVNQLPGEDGAERLLPSMVFGGLFLSDKCVPENGLKVDMRERCFLIATFL